MKLSLPMLVPLAAAASSSASTLEKRAGMYDGFKVFHIEAKQDYDSILATVSSLESAVAFGCEDRKHDHIDVAVAPQDVAALEAMGLELNVMIDDLGAELRLEGETVPYVSTSRTAVNNIVAEGDGSSAAAKVTAAAALPDMSWFDAYHVFEDHLAWLEDLQAAFPGNSEVFVAGNSLEGRPIQGIHLYGSDGPGKHEAIIWHATVHAREWITAPTVEYMAYQLVDGYLTGNCSSKHAIDNYDFYIIPIVNPDGFAYTHSTDRLWRKNRQRRTGTTCEGTDVNRNWPYKWDTPGGSSTDPCSETYRGEFPGDTPEMAVLSNHTLSIGESTGIKFFVDWHSYLQLVLLPYGYSCDVVAANNEYQLRLAAGVASAIKAVNGLEFVYGPTCRTIYQTAGGSNDYVYDVAGAELAWGIELRPSSGKEGGFVIPPENILLSGKEVWAGMRWLLANF